MENGGGTLGLRATTSCDPFRFRADGPEKEPTKHEETPAFNFLFQPKKNLQLLAAFEIMSQVPPKPFD